MTQVSEEQLLKVRQVAESYIADPSAVDSLLEVVKIHGLQGVQPMRAVGSLQRQLKVKPGLYKQMIILQQEFSQVAGADPEKSVEKAKKQNVSKRKKVGLDSTTTSKFPAIDFSLKIDEEKFNKDSYPGIENLEVAPTHCLFTDASKLAPFEVLNFDSSLSQSSKIIQIYKNIWNRRSVGSVVFDMLVEDAEGKLPAEIAAVVGEVRAEEFLKKYSIHWRYCGWFVAYNSGTVRFKLVWINPEVKFPTAQKHAKFDEYAKVFQASQK